MTQVLLSLAAGMLAGYLIRARKNVAAAAGRAAIWSLYLLIFLLGISVGTNATVMRALGTLGIQALILSAGGIVGSVLVSWPVSRVFFDVVRREK
jgi:uncharacterized membrane protein YbjE (DUF340 family)